MQNLVSVVPGAFFFKKGQVVGFVATQKIRTKKNAYHDTPHISQRLRFMLARRARAFACVCMGDCEAKLRAHGELCMQQQQAANDQETRGKGRRARRFMRGTS
jgi:hypothetical protein